MMLRNLMLPLFFVTLAQASSNLPYKLEADDWHLELIAESDQAMELRFVLDPAAAASLAESSGPAVRDPESSPLALGGWIALPARLDPVVEVLAEHWTTGIVLPPAHPSWQLSRPVLRLGQRVAALSINPIAGDAAVLEELVLRVNFSDATPDNPGREGGARSMQQLDQSRRNVLNPGLVERESALRTGGLPLARYLVAAPGGAMSYLDAWVAWRRQQGCDVVLRSREELGISGNNWEPIREAARELYDGDGLDYLLLVGDMNATGGSYHLPGDMVPGGQYAEWGWSRNIVSDHTLTLLEGDDYFPDVMVGRLSVDNHTQLATVVERILQYDQNPLVTDADWLNKATVVYDVSGAGSRRETSLAIRQSLMENGIAPVDTIWNNRDTSPQSPSLVTNALNNGRVLVNYRGFGFRYSWNGPLFGVSQISGLANYGRWPLVTSIVCGGGDFASTQYDPCLGEAFLRAGSVSEPTGAIAFIGPSEEDTHSKWNNALNLGIYQGLLREGIRDVGTLMARGKDEIWRCFPNDRDTQWYDPGSPSQANNVRFYFYCYNLLGDPGTRIRLGEQQVVHLADWHPPAVGSTHVEALVLDMNELPAVGAVVCLTDANNTRLALGLTDETGRVVLETTALEAGLHHLVVHGDDRIPLITDFTPSTETSWTALNSWNTVSADTLLAAGVSFQLAVDLVECGTVGSAAGQTLVLESMQEDLLVLESTIQLRALAPEEQLALQGLEAELGPDVGDGQVLWMKLSLLDPQGLERWSRNLSIGAVGAHPVTEQVILVPATPEPGEDVELLLGLRNAGPLLLDAVSCRLYGTSTACEMLVQDGLFQPLAPDSSAEAGPFQLRIAEEVLAGSLLNLELVFFRADGSTATRMPVTFQVGEAGLEDPVGPDDHGYVIYHDEDDGDAAPTFAYRSISGLGAELPLNDEGVAFNEEGLDGASRALPLPFTFRFYGQDYDTLTVCSNGWIAMGAQADHIIGTNTPIPGAQGPDAMIAVFWTDLYNYYGNSRFGHCYTYHDEEAHTFTVQWDNFQHTGHPYQDNWFQAELRDPAFWPTPTGDGEILLQYNDLVTTMGENLFTVGIERPDQMAGLQYTFNGDYSAAGQTVRSNTALLITTAPRFEETRLDVNSRPADFSILAVAPNPFNPETTVTWNAPSAGRLDWALHDLRGARIRHGSFTQTSRGEGSLRLNGEGLASGLYLLEAVFHGGGRVSRDTARLLLMK